MRDNSVGGGLDDQVLIAEPGRERDAFSDFLRSRSELITSRVQNTVRL
jgi:hypothetical protein